MRFDSPSEWDAKVLFGVTLWGSVVEVISFCNVLPIEKPFILAVFARSARGSQGQPLKTTERTLCHQ
jgi:hypothetical protein